MAGQNVPKLADRASHGAGGLVMGFAMAKMMSRFWFATLTFAPNYVSCFSKRVLIACLKNNFLKLLMLNFLHFVGLSKYVFNAWLLSL